MSGKGSGSKDKKEKSHFSIWPKGKEKPEDSAKAKHGHGSSKKSSKHSQRDSTAGASGDRTPISKQTEKQASKGGNGKPSEDNASLEEYTTEPVHVKPVVTTQPLTVNVTTKVCAYHFSLLY